MKVFEKANSRITREEIEKALKKLKAVKTARLDRESKVYLNLEEKYEEYSFFKFFYEIILRNLIRILKELIYLYFALS